MCNLKSAVKAIFILPVILVLGIASILNVANLSGGHHMSSTLGGMLSGMSTLQTLTLEDDFAVVSSSADDDTAEIVPASSNTITIRAINPGYNTDVGKNTGELIELEKLTENEVDLSQVAIVYTAKPTTTGEVGKSTTLYTFPDGSRMTGESILFRYSDSPEVLDALADSGSFSAVADLTYDTSIAMYGTLSLTRADDVISSVCWLGGNDCLPYFSTTVKSRSYTTILRNSETGEYQHVNDPELLFVPGESGLYLPRDNFDNYGTDENSANDSGSDANPATSPCYGLIFSEILSYYDDDPAEQFIELYNSTSQEILISECLVRYKNKTYSIVLEPTILSPDMYYVLHPHPTFRLTKNPATENLLEITDKSGTVVSSLSYPHGQKKSTSYALIGYNGDGSQNWQITYIPTPGAENVSQEFKICPAGKVLNEATGNCVNASTLSSTLKDCGEGKYRNPETGRCKSYKDTDETTPCKDGYERNPETNRCRKVKENNGADYPVVPITSVEEQSTFIALWALAGVGAIGAGYIIFQFRKEIWYFFRRIFGMIRK